LLAEGAQRAASRIPVSSAKVMLASVKDLGDQRLTKMGSTGVSAMRVGAVVIKRYFVVI
jgi:hypothetical protein